MRLESSSAAPGAEGAKQQREQRKRENEPWHAQFRPGLQQFVMRRIGPDADHPALGGIVFHPGRADCRKHILVIPRSHAQPAVVPDHFQRNFPNRQPRFAAEKKPLRCECLAENAGAMGIARRIQGKKQRDRQPAARQRRDPPHPAAVSAPSPAPPERRQRQRHRRDQSRVGMHREANDQRGVRQPQQADRERHRAPAPGPKQEHESKRIRQRHEVGNMAGVAESGGKIAAPILQLGNQIQRFGEKRGAEVLLERPGRRRRGAGQRRHRKQANAPEATPERALEEKAGQRQPEPETRLVPGQRAAVRPGDRNRMPDRPGRPHPQRGIQGQAKGPAQGRQNHGQRQQAGDQRFRQQDLRQNIRIVAGGQHIQRQADGERDPAGEFQPVQSAGDGLQ
ncbi:MAG: hypothetical protein BWZ10_01791 [candidate division BRC1 bacterium ADurb.BinA364]|nr:MAG: hypothetical protein BWZ10_01791 [candidate division BRC1 bacterium ADurb.BinA364]